VGTDNTILATTNDGQHWHVQYSYRPFLADPGTVVKLDVFFITESKGWAVGGGIYYTKDGGKSWYDLGSETTGPSRIAFANETHGWAVWSHKERSYFTSVGGVPPIDENQLNLGAIFFIFLGIFFPVILTIALMLFQQYKAQTWGSSVFSAKLCTTCGCQILPNAKFCINCGETVPSDLPPKIKSKIK